MSIHVPPPCDSTWLNLGSTLAQLGSTWLGWAGLGWAGLGWAGLDTHAHAYMGAGTSSPKSHHPLYPVPVPTLYQVRPSKEQEPPLPFRAGRDHTHVRRLGVHAPLRAAGLPHRYTYTHACAHACACACAPPYTCAWPSPQGPTWHRRPSGARGCAAPSRSAPACLHPAPCTLHPAPCDAFKVGSRVPAPCALRPAPTPALRPAALQLCSSPCTHPRRPAPCSPAALQPAALQPIPDGPAAPRRNPSAAD